MYVYTCVCMYTTAMPVSDHSAKQLQAYVPQIAVQMRAYMAVRTDIRFHIDVYTYVHTYL
jgi:hypothetical protein